MEAEPNRSAGLARFRAYEEYVSPLQTVEPPRENLERFEWQTDLRHLGLAAFSRARVSDHVSVRTPSLSAKTGLDHIIAYYRKSGSGHMRTEDDTVKTSPGDITFMDLSRPMRTVGSIDTICMGFPRSMLGPLVRDADALHGLVLSQTTPLGRLAAAHLDALAGEIGHMDLNEGRIAAEATAALLAVCANGTPATFESARIRARPALIVTIRHYIEQHLAEALTAETIARHFALSRSTLYRLFAPFGGIDAFIRRRRLARAYQALRTLTAQSGDYIYQVAQTWGFASESAFSHAFRREFLVTPRDVARGAPSVSAAPARTDGVLDLSRVLQDLTFQAP